MTTKFNENGIITGLADSFCIPCETYLNIEDVQAHISKPSHERTFQETSYVEKFKGETIRKMRMGYYCEVCNIMLHTLAKTAIHVKDAPHINNKNEKLIRKLDSGIVVFGDVLIDTNAWHGLSEGSCLICELDYSNEIDHKKDVTHILNLIQSKLELNENQFVYRKIDEDSYNCLICNTVISKETKYTHCDSSDHKDNYLKCQQNKKKTLNVQNVIDYTKNIKSDENIAVKNTVNSDNSKGTEALDKKSPEMMQIALIDKTPGHAQVDDEDIIQSPLEALAKAKAFAKEHNLKYRRNNAYCNVCNVTISSTIKRMKEHVAELSHVEKTKADNKISSELNKKPTDLFIKKIIQVKDFLCVDIVINDQYCINAQSFNFIRVVEGRARCYLCNMNMVTDTVDRHIKTEKHIDMIMNTFVLTDYMTEFIREIRKNIFHCGFCNIVKGSVDQMVEHLNSSDHSQMKLRSVLRLRINLQKIREHEMREVLNFNLLRMFSESIIFIN